MKCIAHIKKKKKKGNDMAEKAGSEKKYYEVESHEVADIWSFSS